MQVHVAWEHYIFKNVDLVAIQSFDPQARIFNWPIFSKLCYTKLKPKDKTLNLFVNDLK